MSNKLVLLAGDPVTDISLLRRPARGGPKGADRAFIVWTEGGGVHLTDRTLKSLGFRTKLIVPDPAQRKPLHSLVTFVALKKDEGKEEFDPAPDPENTFEARIDSFDGYFRDDQAFGNPLEREPDETSDAEVEALFLNDANADMRNSETVAGEIENAISAKIFVHKMHAEFQEKSKIRSALGEVQDHPKLLIVSASDLRLLGIRLRSHLSWDAVLDDLADALRHGDGLLKTLRADYSHVLIQFDVEAVLMLGPKTSVATLLFHPTTAEGSLSEERPGSLYGQMNAFACALLAALAETDWQIGAEPIKRALASARVYASGAVTVTPDEDGSSLTWPSVGIGMPGDPGVAVDDADAIARLAETKALRSVEIPLKNVGKPNAFRLILHMDTGDIRDLARAIVIEGDQKLRTLPAAKIGKFTTVDRTEMESYRTIQRLIDRYIADGSVTKPVSIGVFGPPGAGKSFGIKEIVKKRQIPFLEFNLSEAAAEALPGYFHEIRDIGLDGQVPLCFFDEFDSNGRSLVARFLAPMQDGQFRDGSRIHPIGRAIFVFAGGTARTAQHFCDAVQYRQDGTPEPADPAEIQKAKALKIPDFVSRLAATLDVLGPNPTDAADAEGALLRRAVLLRNLIQKTLPQVVADGDGHADIDPAVIEAFLSDVTFTFGARSIEQVLKMCAVPLSQSRLGVSDLPDRPRLELHLNDPEAFLAKVSRPR